MPALMPAEKQEHIYLDADGVAWIDSTNTKVVVVVRDHLAGFTPERIHEEHPLLSVAQVYASITYYYDHKAEIDADLRRRQQISDSGLVHGIDSSLIEEINQPGNGTVMAMSEDLEHLERTHPMTSEEFAAKVAYYVELKARNGELTDDEWNALIQLTPPRSPGPSPTLESLRRENIYPDRA
jgi:uncharacterized protein (DUF433 family)